jgi:hypothetical protein
MLAEVAAARALDAGTRAELLTNIQDLVKLARAAQRSRPSAGKG